MLPRYLYLQYQGLYNTLHYPRTTMNRRNIRNEHKIEVTQQIFTYFYREFHSKLSNIFSLKGFNHVENFVRVIAGDDKCKKKH